MPYILFMQVHALLTDLIDQRKQDENISIADKLKIWRKQFNQELVKDKEDFNVERTQDQTRDFYW